jgi:Carboxypeptidase regulatory-like domain
MTQSSSGRSPTAIPVTALLLVLLLAGCTFAGAGDSAMPATTTALPGPTATVTALGVPPEIVGASQLPVRPSDTGPGSTSLAATPRPTATPRPRATPRSTGVPATLRPLIVSVAGRVVAGPICPVQRLPPDPACADRPVAGAVLLVTDAGGTEVGRATSDANGEFAIPLPPGSYLLTPQPVVGLMGTARPIQFTVTAGGSPANLDVTYDTGIR